MTPEQLAAIKARIAVLEAASYQVGDTGQLFLPSEAHEAREALAFDDAPALVAEVERLRAALQTIVAADDHDWHEEPAFYGGLAVAAGMAEDALAGLTPTPGPVYATGEGGANRTHGLPPAP